MSNPVINQQQPEKNETSFLPSDICQAIDGMRTESNGRKTRSLSVLVVNAFDTTKSTLMKDPTLLISIQCGLYSIYQDSKIIIDTNPSFMK